MNEVQNDIDLSIIITACNEQQCIEATVREVHEVLRAMDNESEIIVVDDGSTDSTLERLRSLCRDLRSLRVFRIHPNSGKSAALSVGFRHARGRLIATMDADGQDDPEDIPRLVEKLEHCDICCGYRVNRRDPLGKRVGSWIANTTRNRVLEENIIDAGCPLKAFRREMIRDLPSWKGMHRFIPSLLAMRGAVIEQIPVKHRTRQTGKSHYTNWGRLRETAWDLCAVRWMQNRNPRFSEEEVN